MVQGTILAIASDNNAVEPKSSGYMQMYLNENDGALHGKVKGGKHALLAIKLPDEVGITTDGNPKEIFLDTIITTLPSRLKIPLNTTTFFSYFVIATRTGGASPGVVGASGITQLQFMVRNLSGVCSIVVGSGPLPLNTGDPEAAAWTAEVTLGGVNGDELICTVTGEANKTISWNATIVRLAEVNFTL